ncbi:MAG TPA: type IV-A pilus assembly ATPase PilB [Neisseriales bacterium]|jgi:type IV pilus assembly protein PilB|nr:type IV-A pilus assembly ATPase PilB [Burkholderiales bacterium]HCY39003.1 type IV-A pilus assembly ATPase PilB [Neisseriales bacterium]
MSINSGIFTILLQAGVLSAEDVEAIRAAMLKDETSVVSTVTAIRPDISALKIIQTISQFYGLPVLDIAAYNLDFMPKDILPINFIIKHKILPLSSHDKRLKLAVVDPTTKELFESITFRTGLALDFILVDEAQLKMVMDQNSSNYFKTINLDDGALDGVEFAVDVSADSDMVNSDDDDQPIVKFVHKIIYDAVQIGASDIHFEPYEKIYRVRYRIDGVLSEVATPPHALKDKVAARIKVVSKLDIAERRVPQDGRLRLSLSANQIIDFRVSTLPTAYGEKIVLRILDRKSASVGIEALGFEVEQRKIVMNTIGRPYGMMLVTGPTGSGKTVSLYTCLTLLNDSSRNISTAEDPIEIPLSGINQVSINEKTGLTFGIALRAFLRQDPDVIMVGEIRDRDTAEMAIKAAQTGHLVLSTLHTNDAPSALTRLVSMGIPTYNVGDAILTIIAQRLVRKLCPKCKKLAKFDPATLLAAGFKPEDVESGWQPYVPIGCYACHNTGYKGRLGVFEVMPISDELKRLILLNVTSVELATQARKEGVLSLRESGLLKVRSGVTSIAEIEANTNE